jgi:hypothetical protein
MFPNPQDALPLPPRPSLDHYKKRAKDLVKASHDPAALRAWTVHWIDSLVRLCNLPLTPQLPVRTDRWIDQVEIFAREKMSETRTLAAAQFVIARAHGFESWPKLAKHLEAIAHANSTVDNFELAADAIVTGDLATLERLLKQHPELIHARSTRSHQATLLIYVSANGIEGYRQRTPRNIVQIADALLRAGADVNAQADVYGGSTTLGLVATSVHPERAGVQQPLLQLLLDHGATLDHAVAPNYTRGLLVNACLANGRSAAAEFLAKSGAELDLEGAAGVGRLDLVKNYFDSAMPPQTATSPQAERALAWASEYGRNEVVDHLLQRGVSLHLLAHTGQSALHWAIVGGRVETIKLLLDRGAPLELKNTYDGTALGQAIWCAMNNVGNNDSPADYIPIIKILIKAGARIEDGTLQWIETQNSAPAALKRRLIEVVTGR